VARQANRLLARIGTDYSGHEQARQRDRAIVDRGTAPLGGLHFALKPFSRNRGEPGQEAMSSGAGALFVPHDPAGAFDLLRIGDAVSSRNVLAAIHDALRIGIRR